MDQWINQLWMNRLKFQIVNRCKLWIVKTFKRSQVSSWWSCWWSLSIFYSILMLFLRMSFLRSMCTSHNYVNISSLHCWTRQKRNRCADCPWKWQASASLYRSHKQNSQRHSHQNSVPETFFFLLPQVLKRYLNCCLIVWIVFEICHSQYINFNW